MTGKTGPHFATAIIIFFLSALVPVVSSAETERVQAKSAILMNVTSGKILYAQDPDRRIPPASLTKVLTLYMAHEAIRSGRTSPETKVRISRKSCRARGSTMHLSRGQAVPLIELMKGMAVVSGNDASIAVAEHVGGNVPLFVKRMNIKAKKLGMKDTTFKNPNGLPARGQVTTARDILVLSRAYLRDFSGSLEMHSVPDFTFGNRTMQNHNHLMEHMEGVDGLKTGFVRKGGFHIIATAKRDDTRLIAIVMGAKTRSIRDQETLRLLEEGFRITQPVQPPKKAPTMAGASPGMAMLIAPRL